MNQKLKDKIISTAKRSFSENGDGFFDFADLEKRVTKLLKEEYNLTLSSRRQLMFDQICARLQVRDKKALINSILLDWISENLKK